MKPMLAAQTNGLELEYPIVLSPKLDGVRCLIVDGKVLSRSLKPIPNKYVQHLFGRRILSGLDGELIVGEATAADVFNRTSSGVMSINGEPEVTCHVFDDFAMPGGFDQRFSRASARAGNHPNMVDVPHHDVVDEHELFTYEERYVALGYEGVMIRKPDGPYKQGRSTLNEGWLLKLKRFTDSEARVLECIEQMTNTNEAERNALGHLERSSKKAGMVPAGKLGALRVKDLRLGV
jgi:DNA ligase-1